MIKVSAHIARTQLGQILERVARNDERFVVERRGEPAVVIISVAHYLKRVAPHDKALKTLSERVKRAEQDKLGAGALSIKQKKNRATPNAPKGAAFA